MSIEREFNRAKMVLELLRTSPAFRELVAAIARESARGTSASGGGSSTPATSTQLDAEIVARMEADDALQEQIEALDAELDAHAQTIASATVLGHIKVGSGLEIDAVSGVLSALVMAELVDSDGVSLVDSDGAFLVEPL